MASGERKVMLGFLVRWCEAALGHRPTAEEFAAWANDAGERSNQSRLFGRPITVEEASTILGNPGRPVTVNVEPAELLRKWVRKRRAERSQDKPAGP